MSELFEDSLLDEIERDVAYCDLRCFTGNRIKMEQGSRQGLSPLVVWDNDPMFWVMVNPIYVTGHPPYPVVLAPNSPTNIRAFGILLRSLSAWLWRRRFRKWLEVRRYMHRVVLHHVRGRIDCLPRPPRLP